MHSPGSGGSFPRKSIASSFVVGRRFWSQSRPCRLLYFLRFDFIRFNFAKPTKSEF